MPRVGAKVVEFMSEPLVCLLEGGLSEVSAVFVCVCVYSLLPAKKVRTTAVNGPETLSLLLSWVALRLTVL